MRDREREEKMERAIEIERERNIPFVKYKLVIIEK